MKNLFWIPLDLPKFQYSKEIIADCTLKDAHAYPSAFLAQKLTEDVPKYGITKWISNLTESQSKLKEYIETHLPFDDIVNIKVHHPRRKGLLHIDFLSPTDNPGLYKNNKDLEPCGYRLVLSGDNGDLVIKNSKGIQTPIMPEDTDWYTIGSTNVLHAITDSCPDRYIIFCHGWVNKEKHDLLISRSLEKYKDYAIWF